MAAIDMVAKPGVPEPWWKACLAGPPLHWNNGVAVYIPTKRDIVPDTQPVVQSRWSNMRRHHHAWLKREFASLEDRARLIDVGCGPSQFSDLLGRFDVCGIDHFPYGGAHIVADFDRSLPMADATADAAMLSNVLEHIYEPRLLLSECRRVLRPGGRLFVVVPFMIKLHQTPHDYHRYTEFALAAMARDCGFTDVRIDRLGNIFDVYDVDRWVRANLIRAATSGTREVAVRAMIKVQNLAERALQRLLPAGLASSVDTVGFPQSYGMIACRPTHTASAAA